MSAGARQKPRPRLNLAVQYAVSATGKPSRAQFRRWVNAALEHDARITLRIVGQAEGLALNHNFRAKAYATNVLTFVFREWGSVTGGIQGTSIPKVELPGYTLQGDRDNFYLILGVVVPLAILARNLARTYVGRALIAVRDRDISAEILGVNLLRTKLLAFALGAFYAGVAGGVLGYFYGAITPEYFSLNLSIFYLAAVIVGGLGSVLGSILGTIFMTFVPEILRLIAHLGAQWFPGLAGVVLPMGQVIFGLLIIGFLVFEPYGLNAIWRRVRRVFHLWPFKT